jgi:hypothetical protein
MTDKKMKVKELIKKSLLLLGYTDGNGNSFDSRFQAVSQNAVNFILADLTHCLGRDDYKDIKSLEDEISMPDRVIYDVMPYGVAAFIAESMGDGDKQQFFASMYNAKRKSVTYESSVQDVIPAP